MGWIGVDLFFVLSGYLVSGLLFREYQKYGKLNVKRFLIRRGFKIYPLFYITALPYVVVKLIEGKFSTVHLMGDLVFLQNYVSNWAYLYPAGWSLAVEEHFYLGIAFILFFACKSSKFKVSTEAKHNWLDMVVRVILLVLIACLALRVLSNYYLLPHYNVKNFSLTHLRIDSLLAGVLLSYFYTFKLGKLKSLYLNNRKLLLVFSLLCLSWTPFINALPSLFAKTMGFTLLYLSFSIILLAFIMEGRINRRLDQVFTRKGVDYISKIGFSSYSIYIIHTLINVLIYKAQTTYGLYYQPYLYFFITSTLSIGCGFFLTKYIEKYFLNVRNKYFPSKVARITFIKREKLQPSISVAKSE